MLDKRQTPPVKAALKKMTEHLQLEYGIDMTGAQIKKKLNNLKTRLKQRTDLKKTGNISIILTQPEGKLFDLLGGVDNPSVAPVACRFFRIYLIVF